LNLGVANTYSSLTNHLSASSGVMSKVMNVWKCSCIVVTVKSNLDCVHVCIRFHVVTETKVHSLQKADTEF
jgi:hypothetical protein